MLENTRSVEKILYLLSRANKAVIKGTSVSEVCSNLSITEDELKEWRHKYAMPPNAGDILSNSKVPDAVFPFFLEDRSDGRLKQVSSGVLVEIGGELFALTSAHVIDKSKGGALCMPAIHGIEPVSGNLYQTPVPRHGYRAKDNADMAYYHLSSAWRSKLHPSLKSICTEDLLMTDDVETGDLFTFIGYPWRKTKHSAGSHETEQTTYTGHILPSDVYRKLGYDRTIHIVIRMRLKKTYSIRYQSRQTAPAPQGISGGAVLAWPYTYQERLESSALKLAGIGHTSSPNAHYMAATRITPYMMDIVRRNPHLAIHFMQYEDVAKEFGELLAKQIVTINPDNLPYAVGISWYKPNTYERCLEIFDDAVDLPDTFDKWVYLAEQIEKQLQDQGMRIVRVEINPDTFPNWCVEHGFSKMDKHAREAYGNTVAGRTLLQNL